jgi:type III secretion system YscD/HrpQ family protein
MALAADMPDALGHQTVLKLLSGPQEGAELSLGDGDFVIGSDDDDDLVLQDRSVAARHAILVLRSGTISIQARDDFVATSRGLLAPGDDTELQPGTAVALGDTLIGLGNEDTDWTALEMPQPVEKTPPEPAANSAATAAEEEEPRDGGGAASGDSDKAVESPVEPNDFPRLLVEPPSAGSGPRLLLFGALGVLGAVLLLAVVSLLLPDKHTMPDDPWKARLERAQAEIRDLALVRVDATVRNDGTVVLAGYTATEAEKRKLTDVLNAGGIPLENRLWSVERLREAVGETLDRLGGHRMTFDVTEGGILHLSGYLGENLSNEELVSILRSDVPGLDRVDAETRTLGDAVALLRQRLTQSGLAQDVAVTAENGAVVASGNLAPDRMRVWNAVARAYDAQNTGVPKLVSNVKSTGDADPGSEAAQPVAQPDIPPPRDIQVQGVILGKDKKPYALLGDGAMVTVGDAIDRNYIVREIDFGKVVVKSGDREQTFYVGERP